MDLTEVVGLAGGIAGLISLVLTTIFTIRDRRRAAQVDRRQGAAGVSARLEEETYARTDYGWGIAGRYVYVRNDGPLPITIRSVSLGPGPRFFDLENIDVFRPSWPVKIRIPEGRLEKRFLASGDEIRVKVPTPEEMPDPIDDPNLEHPEVDFIDHYGRWWCLCDAILIPVQQPLDPYSRLARRREWFERRRWFRPTERWLRRQAIRRTSRHPRRPSRFAILVDRLWGWQDGGVDSGRFPLNLPASWNYPGLVMPPEELEHYLRTGQRLRPSSRRPPAALPDTATGKPGCGRSDGSADSP